MIVADSSALVAVVFAEPDYSIYADALDGQRVLLGGASLTESMMVVEARLGTAGTHELERVVSAVVETIVPVDEAHARAAFAAWRRFGKGRHPAALNLGDCFSYATAKLAAAPLLFKGNGFAQTDIASALA